MKNNIFYKTSLDFTPNMTDIEEEDICIGCDEWTFVNKLTICKKCAPFTYKCILCEEEKHVTQTFSPNKDGHVHCKKCAACKYCNMEKTGQVWNLECYNPECLFRCPGCEEMKHTRMKNLNSDIYKNVCKDCSKCERCGNQMWDYICKCMV